MRTRMSDSERAFFTRPGFMIQISLRYSLYVGSIVQAVRSWRKHPRTATGHTVVICCSELLHACAGKQVAFSYILLGRTGAPYRDAGC